MFRHTIRLFHLPEVDHPCVLPCSCPCFCPAACWPATPTPGGRCHTKCGKAAENARALSSACQIFSNDDIRAHFGIDAATELKVDEGGGAFPSCSYEWGTDLVVRTIRAGGQEIQVSDPAKLMLVVARGVGPEAFKASTSVYKDAQDIPGIGEQARWGTAMSQLTFLSGSNLVHINVKADSDPETNRQKAIELAQGALRKL